MVDPKTGKPSFEKIIATCRRTVSVEEVQLVRDTMPRAILLQENHDYVKEDEWDNLGWPQDRDQEGADVRRKVAVSNETWQRAKGVSGSVARAERRRYKARVMAKNNAKKAGKREFVADHLARNKTVETSLEGARAPGTTVATSTLAHFSMLKAPLLKSYYYVRMVETQAAGTGLKIPIKGKLETAEAGDKNLIWLAHNSRCKPVILRITDGDEEEDDDGNACSLPTPEPLVVAVLRGEHAEGRDDYQRSASTLFSDDAWCGSLEGAIIGRTSITAGGDKRNCADADTLAQFLRRRLMLHIDLKIQAEEKKNHWVWKLVRANINCLAAMILYVLAQPGG